MRRNAPDTWAGMAMVVIALGLGAPVYLGTIDPSIHRGWWILIYLATLGGLFTAALGAGGRDSLRMAGLAGLAVAMFGSWGLLITLPGMDMIAVLLVFVAANAVYLLRFRWVLLIIAANTAFLLVYGLIRWDTQTIVVMVLFYLAIQVASALSCAALLSEQRMRRELHAANVELRGANALLAESARTAERLRISRDLHDSVGHHLTALSLELEAAKHQDGEKSAAHIDRAGSVAKELLGHVRDTVHALRVEPSDLGAALKSVTEEIPGLDVQLDVAPEIDGLDDDARATLVRAVQEIVSNTIQHADGHTLRIAVARDPDGNITLTSADDGRGAEQITQGNGLRGMRERFESHGGTVCVDGSSGFRVTGKIPAS